MSLTIGDLFASPDHYLHSFDGDTALFVPMDRAAYHRSIFLDGRISPAAEGQMALPMTTLAGEAPQPLATSWIFHVAHCGSTLLARALDRLEGNLVLREPLALRQSAVFPDPARLKLATATISKRYDAGLPTVVKANVPVNFLLGEIAAIDPQARAVFLHLSLRDYILAIMRNDRHREWLRTVTGQLARYLGDLSGRPDAERAAVLWSAQMRAFADAIARMPNARSLDAERFFADPAGMLTCAADCLAVPLTAAEAGDIATGPLFSTYSKNPALAFDNAARMARRAEIERELEPEVEQALAWLAARPDDAYAQVTAVAL